MFDYSLTYTRQDGTRGGLMAGRPTLDETLLDCEQSTQYYVDLGYLVAVDYVRELCPECHGGGDRAHKTNRFKRVKCKRCFGSGHLQLIQLATA
jgi:DnaJ-class molecular chaperone